MPVLVTRAVRVVTASLLGFGIMTSVAAVLQEWDSRLSGFEHVRAVIAMAFFYVLGLPFAGWAALRFATVPTPFATALLGQALLIPVYFAFNKPGGYQRPSWQYGLEGALAYGLAAVIATVLFTRQANKGRITS